MIFKYFLATLAFGSSLYSAGDTANTTTPMLNEPTAVVIDELSVVPNEVADVKELWVTAYSSTPEETDDTPFITASGSYVRDGIVATNLLPFGTKVKIPEHFGDKVFIVEDRMHSRKTENLDIWMPTKYDALRFGITKTKVLVLKDNF